MTPSPPSLLKRLVLVHDDPHQPSQIADPCTQAFIEQLKAHPGALPLNLLTPTTLLDATTSPIEATDLLILGWTGDLLPSTLWDTFCPETLNPPALCLVCTWSQTATEFASATTFPERVIGFSPLGVLTGGNGIELVSSPHSTNEAKQLAEAWVRSLNLEPFWVEDTPAGVLPRTIAMLANEAASAVMEGVATPKDIDTAMQLGTNYPLGPLAWADQMGLDLVVSILDHLYQSYGEDRYRAVFLLRQKVAAGTLGCKAGQGFYAY